MQVFRLAGLAENEVAAFFRDNLREVELEFKQELLELVALFELSHVGLVEHLMIFLKL